MIEEKLQKIKKYYKKRNAFNILEIQFKNYMKSNLYIRLDYYPKDMIYKITWLDLNYGEVETITKFISTEIMNRESVEYIIKILELNTLTIKPLQKKYKEDIVTIKSNIQGIIPGNNTYEFYRYLPQEWSSLSNILVIISKNLPSKLDEYFVQVLAILTGEQYKYDYLNNIKFNIMKDNIDKIFDPIIVEKAKSIEENNITFLEKFDNTYYAIYNDIYEFVIIIKEEEKNKVVLHCSCGCEYYCEHIYKVLEKIQKKEELPFYKVVYNEPDKDLLDRMTNNEYILCTGIIDNKLKLINNVGQIGYLPLLDENNNCNWTILEDTNDYLKCEMEKILNDIINSNTYNSYID